MAIGCSREYYNLTGDAMAETIVDLTPVLLTCLIRRDQATADELTDMTYRVADLLEDASIHLSADFRLYCNGDVASEAVDQEILFWHSNGFLKIDPDGTKVPYLIAKPDLINLAYVNSTYGTTDDGTVSATWEKVRSAIEEVIGGGRKQGNP